MSAAVSGDDERSILDGRKAMNAQMLPMVKKARPGSAKQLRTLEEVQPEQIPEHHLGWANQYATVVHKAMDDHDVYVKQEELDELDARKMARLDAMITLKLVLHQDKNDASRRHLGTSELLFLTEVAESIRFEELGHVIKQRLGTDQHLQLMWLHRSGETIELDLTVWRHYKLANWCIHPWTIHVRIADADGGEYGRALRPILLRGMAKVLFDRYDINMSGHVEKRELLRLFHDLSLEQLHCSDKFLEGFIDGEFARLDVVRTALDRLRRPLAAASEVAVTRLMPLLLLLSEGEELRAVCGGRGAATVWRESASSPSSLGLLLDSWLLCTSPVAAGRLGGPDARRVHGIRHLDVALHAGRARGALERALHLLAARLACDRGAAA